MPAYKTLDDFRATLAQCSFGDWEFHLGTYGGQDMLPGQPYLQVQAADVCNVTGEPMRWHGRKWNLSYWMTRSELVQTAFKAVLTAMEHEVREKFLYRGASIFDPHYNVDMLWALRTGEDNPLDEREPR